MRKILARLIAVLLLMAMFTGLLLGAAASETGSMPEENPAQTESQNDTEDTAGTVVTEDSGTQGDPGISASPDASEDPVVSETPDASENPDIAEDPDAPENPDVPVDSDTPENPDVPEDPDTPENPDIPVDPDAPENPDIPEGPDTPENPDAPEDSDTSENPDVPEDPDTPEDPGATDEPSGETPGKEATIIRIGLHYNNTVLDGANLGNYVGSGFYLGYYNGENMFIPVASTSCTGISVVKTENVYYGYVGSVYPTWTYFDHLTDSTVGVGCYHLELPGNYTTYDEAAVVAGAYENGFVAYISGSYYARIGNYLNGETAASVQSDLANAGISTTIKGTSAYGLSVVETGTNKILFQYDDNGNGTGLGVIPIPTAEDQMCLTWFKSVEWNGGFRFERIGGKDMTVVNMVELDDYVKGVISSEMVPTWPLEALKAQAVCARNYVLYNQNRHKKYHFDLCATVCCQAYSGRKKATEHTDVAVEETAGVIATCEGKIVSLYYHSSNGGATENSSLVWGSKQELYPYLIGVEDPYEALVTIPSYQWKREYTAESLTSQLNAKGYDCSTIVSAKVSTYSATGNPAAVTFTDSRGKSYTLTAIAMQKIFPLQSWRYDFVYTEEPEITINEETPVEKLNGLYVIDGEGNIVPIEGDVYLITDSGVMPADTTGVASGEVFTIVGKGWGHNVGMSQYGAYSMAMLGHTYEEILRFYYTGIEVG